MQADVYMHHFLQIYGALSLLLTLTVLLFFSTRTVWEKPVEQYVEKLTLSKIEITMKEKVEALVEQNVERKIGKIAAKEVEKQLEKVTSRHKGELDRLQHRLDQFAANHSGILLGVAAVTAATTGALMILMSSKRKV